MRKGTKLNGQVLGTNDAVDVVSIGTGTNQPTHKSVGLTELEAHRVGGSRQRCIGNICRPLIEHLLLEIIQASALAGGQGTQSGLYPCPLPLHASALVIHRLVDNGQIDGIVEETMLGIDFGIDSYPEL